MPKHFPQYFFVAIFLGIVFLLLPKIGGQLRDIYQNFQGFFSNLYYAEERGEEIMRLKGENASLYSKLIMLVQLEKENDLLRRQLGVQNSQRALTLTLAEVIGQGSTLGKETLIINRGLEDGLKGGEAVIISPNILIGQVYDISAHHAIVLLIFNKEFQLPVISSLGTRGVLKGDVGHQIALDEVSQANPLNPGDIILTSNQSSLTPAGLLIGKVEKIISKPTDIFKKALLGVMFQDTSIDSVFIVSPLAPQ